MKPACARRAPIETILLVCLSLLFSGPALRADTYQDYQGIVTQAEQARQQGDDATAFREYISALLYYPNADLPRNALIGMMGSGLPERMDLNALPTAPGLSLPYSLSCLDLKTAGDPRSSSSATLLIPDPSLNLKEVSDPENGWPFAYVLYVYRNSSLGSGPASLLCAVHFQTADSLPLARRVGSLLYLLREAYVQKTAQRPVGDTHSFQVWLCQRAPDTGGGEEWHGNLYFYDIDEGRSSLEWIREIAHEYSHLAVPAIGGNYTAPEAWANGYAGERLLVRWLSQGAAGGNQSVERFWGGTFSGYPNFDRLLIKPDEQLYLDNGLSRKWLARPDALGMRYMIGLLLWIDDQKGSRFLGSLLENIYKSRQTDPQALYAPALAMIEHLPPRTAAHTEARRSVSSPTP